MPASLEQTFKWKMDNGKYPGREELYQHYIVDNWDGEKICNYYHFSKGLLKTLLKYYGIKKDKSLQMALARKKWIEHYGTDAPMKVAAIRAKSVATCQEKYGVDMALQNPKIAAKARATTREHFGTDYALSSPEVIQKGQETCLRKYGVSNYAETEEYKQKIRDCCQKRYGVPNVTYINMDPNSVAILQDKDRFSELVKSQKHCTCNSIASALGCSLSTALVTVNKYGLRDYVVFDPSISYYEEDIEELLRSWGITIDTNTRSILDDTKELDIYAPNEKVGIEFNGSYWHSEPALNKHRPGIAILYHQKKSLDAESKGIQLFHIFEYQWNDPRQKPIIISRLKNLFHKDDRVIYGRETEIRDVPDEERKAFLDANHMQGSDHATRAYGLYCKDELVSIMTFCKPRFNKNYRWELSRFCSKCGCSVVGGASKLFKHFLENNEGSVLSYSDIATASGGLYGTLGFKLLSVNHPSYVWWRSDNDYKSRFQCQMKDERKTMSEAGYVRIFDAGTKTWVLHR
jgi:hypothetical protein